MGGAVEDAPMAAQYFSSSAFASPAASIVKALGCIDLLRELTQRSCVKTAETQVPPGHLQ